MPPRYTLSGIYQQNMPLKYVQPKLGFWRTARDIESGNPKGRDNSVQLKRAGFSHFSLYWINYKMLEYNLKTNQTKLIKEGSRLLQVYNSKFNVCLDELYHVTMHLEKLNLLLSLWRFSKESSIEWSRSSNSRQESAFPILWLSSIEMFHSFEDWKHETKSSAFRVLLRLYQRNIRAHICDSRSNFWHGSLGEQYTLPIYPCIDAILFV